MHGWTVGSKVQPRELLIEVSKHIIDWKKAIKSYRTSSVVIFKCKEQSCKFRIMYSFSEEKIVGRELVIEHECNINERGSLPKEYLHDVAMRGYTAANTSISGLKSIIEQDINNSICLLRKETTCLYNSLREIKRELCSNNDQGWDRITSIIDRYNNDNGSSTLGSVASDGGVVKNILIRYPYTGKFSELEENLVFLDGCYIKSSYGGCLLALCTITPDKNIIPLSYMYCNEETLDNVKEFLSKNSDLLGRGTTVISDHAASFETALKEYECSHALCCFHLLQHVKKGAHDTLSIMLTTNSERIYTIEKQRLKSEHPGLYRKIEKDLPKYVAFEGCPRRFGYKASSPIESLNSSIIDSRKSNIVDMIVGLIEDGARRFTAYVKNVPINQYNLPKWLINTISDMERSDSCIILGGESTATKKVYVEFSPFLPISGTEFFTVNTLDYTCSCMRSNDTGYPCCHAAKTFKFQRSISLVSEFWRPSKLNPMRGIDVIVPNKADSTMDQNPLKPFHAAKRGRPHSRFKTFAEVYYNAETRDKATIKVLSTQTKVLEDYRTACDDVKQAAEDILLRCYRDVSTFKNIVNCKQLSVKSLTDAMESLKCMVTSTTDAHLVKKRLSHCIRTGYLIGLMKKFEESKNEIDSIKSTLEDIRLRVFEYIGFLDGILSIINDIEVVLSVHYKFSDLSKIGNRELLMKRVSLMK